MPSQRRCVTAKRSLERGLKGVEMTYRVRNWKANFEISQSRKVPKLSWVAIPNKHDGKGFLRLLSERDGSALYGCWILIVQVASKCPERGTLADEDGPLTPADIALKTRVSVELVERTLKRLSDNDIRWIESDGVTVDAPSVLSERSEQAIDTLHTGQTLHNKHLPSPSADGGKKLKRKEPEESKVNWFGLWIDINREKRRPDPLPLGPDTNAAQRLAKALGYDEQKYRAVCEAYLKDQDQFLRNKGYALQYLAPNKYVGKINQGPSLDMATMTTLREAERKAASESAEKRIAEARKSVPPGGIPI